MADRQLRQMWKAHLFSIPTHAEYDRFMSQLRISVFERDIADRVLHPDRHKYAKISCDTGLTEKKICQIMGEIYEKVGRSLRTAE